MSVWLGACGAAVPKLPSQGGPAWREVKSEHITLWTDASSARGHALVREMEKRRQVMTRAMRFAPQSARIFAIALRNERELAAFLPSDVSAQAWSSAYPSLQAGIALQADSPDEEQAQVLNHELAHAISFGLIKHQPVWLAEGLATYFENVEYDGDNPTVQLGVPRRDQAIRLREAGALHVAELFACNQHACSRSQDYYATSWLLFSHLLNSRFDAFGRYLRRLQELPPDQYLRAWDEAFPGLSLAKLDGELSLLIRTFELVVPRIPVTVQTYPSTERELGDADALAARSLLHMLRDRSEAALATAKAALAAEPTHVLAWWISAYLEEPPSVAQARAVVAANPDDWRSWRMLSKLEEGDAERTQARQRSCALAAKDGDPCAPEPAE